MRAVGYNYTVVIVKFVVGKILRYIFGSEVGLHILNMQIFNTMHADTSHYKRTEQNAISSI